MTILPERLRPGHGPGPAEPSRAPRRAPISAVPAPTGTEHPHRRSPFRWWAARAATLDVLIAGAAMAAAIALRFRIDEVTRQPVAYDLVAPVLAVVWILALVFCGAYSRRASLFGVEEARSIARAGVVLLAAVGVLFFVTRLGLSRSVVATFLVLVVVGTALGRWPLRAWLRRRQRRGRTQHRAAVVGPAAEVDPLLARLARTSGPVVAVAAIYEGDDPDDVRRTLEYLGGPAGPGFDLLMRAGQPGDEEAWILAETAGRLGVDFAVAPRHTDGVNLVFRYVPIGATPLLLVEAPFLRLPHRVVKGTYDRVLAALALVVLSPLMAVIALTILVRDGRPVFFAQERVGRLGRRFRMWKFRSMVPDAEARLAGLRDHNEADGPLFKLRADPRITATGAFLRRWSLDELPQLVNVVAGRMSLVGPRPPLPEEVDTYDERTSRRLLVKPGLTGLWQVTGRADLAWDESVYLDVAYVDHWSPLLDAAILLRTARAVVHRNGAY